MLSVIALTLAMATDAAAGVQMDPTAVAKPVYGPPVPKRAPPKLDKIARSETEKQCAAAREKIADKTTILVCGQTSDQYRLDPDIIHAEEARRAARHGTTSRPSMPGAMPDTGICERSGGCRALESINWVAVALVTAQMIDKAVKGENVGKTFVTSPRPSEYDYYRMAKAEREAKELEDAANDAVARARDAKASKAAAAPSSAPSQ